MAEASTAAESRRLGQVWVWCGIAGDNFDAGGSEGWPAANGVGSAVREGGHEEEEPEKGEALPTVGFHPTRLEKTNDF